MVVNLVGIRFVAFFFNKLLDSILQLFELSATAALRPVSFAQLFCSLC